MDILSVMERFPDQAACIEHLEEIRWQNKPRCPKCEGLNPTRKNESGLGRIGRWHCTDCGASFKVTSGTIFAGTKIPLPKVVFSNHTDGKCKEKSIQLPTCTRFRVATTRIMAFNDEDTCRDGEKLIIIRRDR